MRLLFVTPAYPPFTGGGERYVKSLAETLAGRGHAVTIVTSDAQQEQDFWQPRREAGRAISRREDSLSIIRCPLMGWSGGWGGLLAWRKAMVLISSLPGNQSRLLGQMARRIPPIANLEAVLAGLEPPDVVVGFNLSWEYAPLAAAQYARRRGIPFVFVPFAHLGDAGHRRVARNNTMDHQRRLVENADAVLALTAAEVDGFAAWGIRPERITVVGSGVDLPPPLPDPAGVLQQCRLRPPLAIFVGRVNYDKGAIHAAQAVIKLNQSGLPLTLALVGRIAADFARYYDRLSPAEREIVRPLGMVGEIEKHSLLREAAVLLLPSRTDSFGIVLLEAWLQGTPVVGARVGGVGSVIQDELDGLLVPFGDVPALAAAVQRLVTDIDLNRQMGADGRARVLAEFTWENVADKIETILLAVQQPAPIQLALAGDYPQPFVAS
jgi:glycosyltransferase involved in cell wall biosynthesis